MALQIRIVPASLHSAAARQNALSDRLEESTATLEALKGALSDAWDGSASSQAIESLDEFVSFAKAIGSRSRDGAEVLAAVAQAFEAIDEGSPFAFRAFNNINKMIAIRLDAEFPFMVTESLRIIPEEVRQVAEQCKQLAAEYVDAVVELRNLSADLGQDWEGAAYDRFASQQQELSDGCKQLSAALSEFAERIHRAATRYEELDVSLSRMV